MSSEPRTRPDYLTFDGEKRTNVITKSDNALIVNPLQDGSESHQSFPSSTLQPVLPPLLVLSASVLFSGQHTCVRFAFSEYNIPPLVTAVFRGTFQIIMVALLIWILGTGAVSTALSRNSGLLLLLRGLFGGLAIAAKFGSLARLPVGVATSLFANTPIFATILGWIISKEGMTTIDIFALCVSTFGSILVGLSGKNEEMGEEVANLQWSHVIGVLLGLLGALAAASVFILMRVMGERVHFLLSVFSHGLGMMLLPMLFTFGSTRNFEEAMQFYANPLLETGRSAYIPLISIVLFSFLATLCQNRSAQLLPAGRVGVLRAFDIPINFLVAFVFLGELPDSFPQLAGCVIILISTTLMAYNAMRN